MKRGILTVLIALGVGLPANAQGVRHVNIAQGTVKLVGSSGFSGNVSIPLASATITVCNGNTLPAPGATCTGLASIFSDVGLTQVLSNPTNADSGGNYSFYAAGGLPYVISVSSVGFTTFSYVWSAPLSNFNTIPVVFSCTVLNQVCVIVSGNATGSNNTIQLVNTASGGHTWNIGEIFATGRLSFRDVTQTGGPSWNFVVGGTVTAGGIFTHSNTSDRTYAYPDASGNVVLDSAPQTLTNKSTLVGSLVGVVASGTATMTTALIAAGACGTTVTVSNPNVLSTDVVTWSYSGLPGANPGVLIVNASTVGATSVQFEYCNPTAGSITPNATTLNWKVVR